MTYIEVMGKAEEQYDFLEGEDMYGWETRAESMTTLWKGQKKRKTLSTLIKKKQFEAVFKHTTHWILVKRAKKAKTKYGTKTQPQHI